MSSVPSKSSKPEKGSGAPQEKSWARRLRRKFSDLQTLLYPLAGWIILSWIWAVNRWVRVDRRGPAFEYIRDGKPFIYTFWHEDCFPLMFEMSRGFRASPPIIMASPGRTGSIGTYLISLFGVEAVAGSGAKSGRKAVRTLTERVRAEPQTVYVLADGSRGPNHEARWGAIYLARDTGYPIIAGRAWGNRLACLWWTWMRLVLPLPFGRQILLTSEPLYVPADTDKEGLKDYRDQLQQRLDELSQKSLEYFNGNEKAVETLGPPVDPFPTPPPRESTATS